jgi:hypothetical protein
VAGQRPARLDRDRRRAARLCRPAQHRAWLDWRQQCRLLGGGEEHPTTWADDHGPATRPGPGWAGEASAPPWDSDHAASDQPASDQPASYLATDHLAIEDRTASDRPASEPGDPAASERAGTDRTGDERVSSDWAGREGTAIEGAASEGTAIEGTANEHTANERSGGERVSAEPVSDDRPGRERQGRAAAAARDDDDSVWRPTKDDDDPNWARDLARAVEDTSWDAIPGEDDEDEPDSPGDGASGGSGRPSGGSGRPSGGSGRPSGGSGRAPGGGSPAPVPADAPTSTSTGQPQRGLFEPSSGVRAPAKPAGPAGPAGSAGSPGPDPGRVTSGDSIRRDREFNAWAPAPTRSADDFISAATDPDAAADWDRLAAGAQASRGRTGTVAERWTAQTDVDVANEWPGPPLRAARQASILNRWTDPDPPAPPPRAPAAPAAPATSAPATSALDNGAPATSALDNGAPATAAPDTSAPDTAAPATPAPAAVAPKPWPGHAATDEPALGAELPAGAATAPGGTGPDTAPAKPRRPARPPLDLPVPPDPADEWISLLTADPAEE